MLHYNYSQLFSDIAQANAQFLHQINHNDNSTINIMSSYLDGLQVMSDSLINILKSQQHFYQEQLTLCDPMSLMQTVQENTTNDKRFTDNAWQNNMFFAAIKQQYQTFCAQCLQGIATAKLDADVKNRKKFFMQQYLDAMSPTNFFFSNPEVMREYINTNGNSLLLGMQNMLHDMQQGHISMTDASQFTIGKNLAATAGSVIYRNELIEIIHYKPSTAQFYQTPLLIIPPCINKYYILDLQQSNSLVKFLVDSGLAVFLISWKSADESIQHLQWDDYTLNIIAAIDVVRNITQQNKINTIGYCVGGVLLTTAVSLLKSKGRDIVNSMLQITTMLDHSEPGEIKVFLNDSMFPNSHKHGIMPGRIIGQIFSSLRANDLIWSYWINNYLLGRTPATFDLLYWNSDVVNLPALMHGCLIQKLYIENLLIQGKLMVAGELLNLEMIDCPIYLFAAQKDHIVPWMSAYKSTQLFHGSRNIRFVLGSSGHTAGVVSPIGSNKRNYWINDRLTNNPVDWLNNATICPGSWWKNMQQWLIQHSNTLITVVDYATNTIAAAPGLYVTAKA